tara:strand:+ start:46 stop:588 length:543 start_codon:yes stop_codon:yes gene_type:complete
MFFNSDKETDDMVMFNILEGIDYYSGTERRNMLKVPKGDGSMLWGNTWKGFLAWRNGEKILRTPDPNHKGRYLTKVKAENPHLQEVFYEYSNKYFPDFEYKQVQMNKNYPCPPHTDRNKGESICIAFGDYTGGLLCIEKENGIEKYDSRLLPTQFDGFKYKHWVEPYMNGTRYSLVFFNN